MQQYQTSIKTYHFLLMTT